MQYTGITASSHSSFVVDMEDADLERTLLAVESHNGDGSNQNPSTSTDILYTNLKGKRPGMLVWFGKETHTRGPLHSGSGWKEKVSVFLTRKLGMAEKIPPIDELKLITHPAIAESS